MTDPYAGREADRLAYLLHRLKHPGAPPLLLPDWPDDPELEQRADAAHAVLSAQALADLMAAIGETLLICRASIGALRCQYCLTPLAPPRRHYCDAVCEAAATAESA